MKEVREEDCEMTLREKFDLMCEALSVSPEDILSREITRDISIKRNCIIHQLYDYRLDGLPELLDRTRALIVIAHRKFQNQLEVNDPLAIEYKRLIDERLERYLNGEEE